MTFQNNFFNPDGTFYSPKVSELLVPELLGYTYTDAPAGPAPASATPAVVSFQRKLQTVYAGPNLNEARASGVAAYVAQNTGTATPAKYLEVKVDVDANALNAVARRRSTSTGSETLGLSKSLEAATSGARAYVLIRDISFTDQANTEYRVFINCPYLTPGT